MGIIENNLDHPDLYGFEIKVHRKGVNSPVTLCTQKPSYPDRPNERLKDMFGKPDKTFNEIKSLHVSMFGDRHSSVYGQYSFRLVNDRIQRKLYIKVYSLKDYSLLDDKTYYDYSVLEIKFKEKLKKLFYVEADRKYDGGSEYFNYISAQIYTNPSFEKFMDLVDNGAIQYDIRLGAYKSGNKFGMPHDHGSGFRIRSSDMYKLYVNVENIT